MGMDLQASSFVASGHGLGTGPPVDSSIAVLVYVAADRAPCWLWVTLNPVDAAAAVASPASAGRNTAVAVHAAAAYNTEEDRAWNS